MPSIDVAYPPRASLDAASASAPLSASTATGDDLEIQSAPRDRRVFVASHSARCVAVLAIDAVTGRK